MGTLLDDFLNMVKGIQTGDPYAPQIPQTGVQPYTPIPPTGIQPYTPIPQTGVQPYAGQIPQTGLQNPQVGIPPVAPPSPQIPPTGIQPSPEIPPTGIQPSPQIPQTGIPPVAPPSPQIPQIPQTGVPDIQNLLDQIAALSEQVEGFQNTQPTDWQTLLDYLGQYMPEAAPLSTWQTSGTADALDQILQQMLGGSGAAPYGPQAQRVLQEREQQRLQYAHQLELSGFGINSGPGQQAMERFDADTQRLLAEVGQAEQAQNYGALSDLANTFVQQQLGMGQLGNQYLLGRGDLGLSLGNLAVDMEGLGVDQRLGMEGLGVDERLGMRGYDVQEALGEGGQAVAMTEIEMREKLGMEGYDVQRQAQGFDFMLANRALTLQDVQVGLDDSYRYAEHEEKIRQFDQNFTLDTKAADLARLGLGWEASYRISYLQSEIDYNNGQLRLDGLKSIRDFAITWRQQELVRQGMDNDKAWKEAQLAWDKERWPDEYDLELAAIKSTERLAGRQMDAAEWAAWAELGGGIIGAVIGAWSDNRLLNWIKGIYDPNDTGDNDGDNDGNNRTGDNGNGDNGNGGLPGLNPPSGRKEPFKFPSDWGDWVPEPRDWDLPGAEYEDPTVLDPLFPETLEDVPIPPENERFWDENKDELAEGAGLAETLRRWWNKIPGPKNTSPWLRSAAFVAATYGAYKTTRGFIEGMRSLFGEGPSATTKPGSRFEKAKRGQAGGRIVRVEGDELVSYTHAGTKDTVVKLVDLNLTELQEYAHLIIEEAGTEKVNEVWTELTGSIEGSPAPASPSNDYPVPGGFDIGVSDPFATPIGGTGSAHGSSVMQFLEWLNSRR